MTLPLNPPSGPVTLSANARTVLEKRYLVKREKGEPVEQPEDLFWRVATVVAEADRRYGATDEGVQRRAEEFYSLMTERRFEPNSPTLMNAGRPLGQLSACFVLPIEDALSNGRDGIYDTLRAMALIHQSGGGTGFAFSKLRAKGSMVRSTTGVASGPVSFMKLYDASTDAVKQGGTRRGANMGILRVDHPDIMDFITCKEDLTQVTNFNISVAVTDKFMAAVKAETSYDLIDPSTGKVAGQLDARTVWDKMIDGAWRTGEPGCFFIDEANRYNPVPHVGQYDATNPCGEQPLLPYDVCNLGSINVGYYVKDGQMDWSALRRDIHLSVHFLDNIIDVNKYPLPEIDALSKRIRRIGFGIMGFADALVRLGIAYNGVEGVEFGRQLQKFVDLESKRESERLANERGPFPEWARSIWGPDETCARDARGNRVRPMQLLRNCNVNTIAPTGTISIIAGCSSGIEPLFAVAFMRNQAGVLMPDVNEDFVSIAKKEGWYSDELMEKIAKEGHIHFDEVPKQVQFDAEAENLQRRAKRARPDTLRGITTRIETPLGTMFLNITEDDRGQPFEVFINLGKAGGAAMADAEAIGRLISLALRSGIPIREVHRQLRGIASDKAIGLGPNKVLSVPDAIGIALEKWMREKQGVQQDLLGAAPTPPSPVEIVQPNQSPIANTGD